MLDLFLYVSGAYCGYVKFRINGIEADVDDFGDAYDHGCERCDDEEPEEGWHWGGCYNMQFDAKPAEEEVLRKYGITEEEYHEVCKKLREEYDIGKCGMCN